MFDCVLKTHIQFSVEKKSLRNSQMMALPKTYSLMCIFSGNFVNTFRPTTLPEAVARKCSAEKALLKVSRNLQKKHGR